jgi:H+/gluconate symporter-like permease
MGQFGGKNMLWIGVIFGLVAAVIVAGMIWRLSGRVDLGEHLPRLGVSILVGLVAFEVWRSNIPNVIPAFEETWLRWAVVILVVLGVIAGLAAIVAQMMSNLGQELKEAFKKFGWTAFVLGAGGVFTYCFLGLTGIR